MRGPDGRTNIHTMLGRGENNLLFGDHEAIKRTFPPRSDETDADVAIPITNVVDYYEEVRAREGAQIVHELEDRGKGDRTFTVRDINGYLITFYEHHHDVSPQLKNPSSPHRIDC